jgi:hypothetical protein
VALGICLRVNEKIVLYSKKVTVLLHHAYEPEHRSRIREAVSFLLLPYLCYYIHDVSTVLVLRALLYICLKFSYKEIMIHDHLILRDDDDMITFHHLASASGVIVSDKCFPWILTRYKQVSDPPQLFKISKTTTPKSIPRARTSSAMANVCK